MNRNAKILQAKAQTHIVILAGDHYEVLSGKSGNTYNVQIDTDTAICSCPYGTQRMSSYPFCGCSHVLAVGMFIQAVEHGRALDVWATQADAKRQKQKALPAMDGLFLTSPKIRKPVRRTTDQLIKELGF